MRQYKRLINAMQWVAILSEGEAMACIRDFKSGSNFSGEAVNHFGGTRAVVDAAIKGRRRARMFQSLTQLASNRSKNNV